MNTRKNKIIILFVIISFIILPFTVFAVPITLSDEISIRSIDQSPYYDSQPSVWGDYIVWRRGVNQNENNKIELREASWIMVHDLKRKETYNITPELKILMNNLYHHAQSPHIWGNKVLYEAQYGGNSTDVSLYLYDLKSGETTRLPTPTKNPQGRLHRIFGDWVVYTDRNDNKRQAHLYNYATGVHRVLIGNNEPYSIYGLEIWDTKIVFTILNQTISNNKFEIWIYDISQSKFDKIFTNSTNQIMATSIYKNQIGITEQNNQTFFNSTLNETGWSVHVYDFVSNNFTFTQHNTFGILVKENSITYQSTGNIILIETGQEPYIIESGVNQYIGDKHGRTLVWMSNINSGTQFGDARDSFDIYVLTVITTKDKIFSSLYIIIPVIIAGLFIYWFYHERNRGIA